MKDSFSYIPRGYFKVIFENTLKNYLDFVTNTLKLPLPLRFKAGATDV
jgi:hypothetical protein